VMSVAIAPSGQLVAIGGADGTIQLWQRMWSEYRGNCDPNPAIIVIENRDN
jgi:WD40 repeat protein